MKRLQVAAEFPLLIKELSELAVRPRTYIVRFGYAAVLFTVACLLIYGNPAWTGGTGVLGQGREMFFRLIMFQFFGVYLFLPAMASGVLTIEKERDCLGVLLLTTLRPWSIILQKLFSRLIPMFTFLLVGMPLMAIAYNFGGVTTDQIASAVWLLVLTCLQVGSLSILCSAYFRTTPEAFVGSYLLMLAPLAFPLVFMVCCFSPEAMAGLSLTLYAPAVFDHVSEQGDFSETLGASIPIIFSTIVFLVMARSFLESRAFVPPKNLMLQFFRSLDGFFNDLNQITGGVVLVRDHNLLPREKPIAWRETAKKSLGTFRYLFRVFVVIELPILFVCQAVRVDFNDFGIGENSVTVLLYLLWCISAGMVAVHAASLISSERSRQTLGVLLTAPLTGRDIVLQKFRGVTRLLLVLSVPFFTIYIFQSWWHEHEWGYFLFSLMTAAAYLPLVTWFALWMGLKLRSQVRAIIVTVSILVAWAAIPVAVRGLLVSGMGVDLPEWSRWLFGLSPVDVIRAIESGQPEAHGLPRYWEQACVVGCGVYMLLAALFCFLCLEDADRSLGRVPQGLKKLPGNFVPPAVV